MSGLGESVNGEWSGDVNMDEGALELFRNEYIGRLEFVKRIGSEERRDNIEEDLNTLSHQVTDDIKFIGTSKNQISIYIHTCMRGTSNGTEVPGFAFQ